jgi:hypothetical protein
MNKNGVIAVVVVVAAIVLLGLWAMRSGQDGAGRGPDCSAPPAAPAGLTHSKSGDIVTLSWQAPAVTDEVSTYVIKAGSKPGGEDQGTFVAAGNVTTFQRQAPAGQYHVRIFARNACGTSAASEEIIVQMP